MEHNDRIVLIQRTRSTLIGNVSNAQLVILRSQTRRTLHELQFCNIGANHWQSIITHSLTQRAFKSSGMGQQTEQRPFPIS